jgi:hypothetical protein
MNANVEHFCTLFDKNYLPLGMTLHSSLMTHAESFHLWILCMDELVEAQLWMLALPNVTLVPLKTVETPELLAVKSGRSPGEYCWTLTPFTFQIVFDLSPDVQRVTYLDADLFFFDTPQILLDELGRVRKHVLITEHSYAPKYDQTALSGRFCVQFVTFNRTREASKVMQQWQNQCLEWCFNRQEGDRFGDQKYLDSWPNEFEKIVHICSQPEKTLAPWNIDFYSRKNEQKVFPVFYHFHGLRILSPNLVRLYTKYKVGCQGQKIYKAYMNILLSNIEKLVSLEIPIPCLPIFRSQTITILRYTKQIIFREISFVFLKKIV